MEPTACFSLCDENEEERNVEDGKEHASAATTNPLQIHCCDWKTEFDKNVDQLISGFYHRLNSSEVMG